jgi:hypothetical protein
VVAEVKNVESLLIKVFEIDTFNYCLGEQNDVDASIDLDGLVANEERTITLDAPALQRTRIELDFPSIRGRGVWIVELLGNGIASRAVVRKGSLRAIERVTSYGHEFRVVDETGAIVRDASIWFGGREYASDEEGRVGLPFSTDPGRKRIVLRRPGFAAMASFDHASESYELGAAIHVERETMQAGKLAKLLLRPSLTLNGVAIELARLEQPLLRIHATDLDGIVSTTDVRGEEFAKALGRDGEYVHEFRVPEDLVGLTASLSGRVKPRASETDEPVSLTSGQREFRFNVIDRLPETATYELVHREGGYALDLRGKDGEPRADVRTRVSLRFADFTDDLQVDLRTDANGRIQLGPLPGVTAIGIVDGAGTMPMPWHLAQPPIDAATYVTARAGDVVRLPYPYERAGRREVSLLQVRADDLDDPIRDAFAAVSLDGGLLELRNLAAGVYRLDLRPSGERFVVDVADGERIGPFVRTPTRMVEAGASTSPLQVRDVTRTDEGVLRIRIAGADASTRVHVAATRFLPPYPLYATLRLAAPASPWRTPGEPSFEETTYHAGRRIGDEYRYILERRLAKKFPGNMLDRPGLLLNPWSVEETATAIGLGGGGGGRYGGRAGGRAKSEDRGESGADLFAGIGLASGVLTDFDWLPEASVLLVGLRPDENGVVSIPVDQLGEGQHVHVLAVDRERTAYSELALSEVELEPLPTRMLRPFDPGKPLAERRRIEFVAGGSTAVVDDASNAQVDTIDSLASVFGLFRTLSGDPELARFEFVLRWPTLGVDERLALYSEHACHELHVFLYFKDRAFFDSFVLPYLANKADTTFVDEWLLGKDLTGYLDPWAFDRLNVAEKILLASRLEGAQRAGILRRIEDRVALMPRDPGAEMRLFRSVLGAEALAAETGVFSQAGADLRLGLETATRDRYRGPADSAPGRPAVNERARAARRQAGPESPGAPAPDAAAAGEQMDEEPLAEELEVEETEDSAFDSNAWNSAVGLGQDRKLYRAPGATRRYVERNYWNVPITLQDADLVAPNAFWADFALADPSRPFVSPHVAEVAMSGSFAEMMLALSVLDLPFEKGEQDVSVDGTRMSLQTSDPLLLVRQEIAPAELADERAILASQNFFRNDRRVVWVDGEQRDAWVTDEFLVGLVYGCRAVVTNPTSRARDLDLLLQVPEGAIEVAGSLDTRTVAIRLEPYTTQQVEYLFYFPRAGEDLKHYPLTVADSRTGTVVAMVDPTTFDVVVEPSTVDERSWEFVSQDASMDAVLEYLRTRNLFEIELDRIAWRMVDKSAFEATLDVLRQRKAYSRTLWSYGFRHGDRRAMREMLQNEESFLRQCGPALESPLATIDPVERRWYEHAEYQPLYNSRAHRFGGEQRILNADLARQYLSLLDVLAHRPTLDADDWFDVTYYMLLQDRIEDALDAFARVDPAALHGSRLQYDAMRAHLAFYREDLALARRIAAEHRDHPVARWRELFRQMLAHLDEAEGTVTADDERPEGVDLASTEPTLELAAEGGALTLSYRNLETCELRYFLLDVEFAFSTRPFVQQGSGSFAYVRPNRIDELALAADTTQRVVPIPAEFAGRNVLVEARAAGLVRRQPVYTSDLDVQWIENRGQLRVTAPDDGRPLPGIYVKVFRRLPNGQVRFHKDGYTDLRGRFDYVSMSGEDAMVADAFAVLVTNTERGAVIRELAPPAR